MVIYIVVDGELLLGYIAFVGAFIKILMDIDVIFLYPENYR